MTSTQMKIRIYESIKNIRTSNRKSITESHYDITKKNYDECNLAFLRASLQELITAKIVENCLRY